jgi:biopolymer transport protein ExbD
MSNRKIARKSTDTDMTPFVDIAFLILSFFIMATKFKPPEPVEIKTPGSVLSQKLPDNNAILVTIDSSDKVYFTIMSEKNTSVYDDIIKGINTSQNLGLSPAEMANFKKTFLTGVPFAGLKQLLGTDEKAQASLRQPGIPVKDTANNQLYWWIREAKAVFANNREELKYLIKGDGKSKYPAFEAVIAAFKKNDVLKYNLVTALDDIPSGSELDKYLQSGQKIKK